MGMVVKHLSAGHLPAGQDAGFGTDRFDEASRTDLDASIGIAAAFVASAVLWGVVLVAGSLAIRLFELVF